MPTGPRTRRKPRSSWPGVSCERFVTQTDSNPGCTGSGPQRTADEDGYILVLSTPSSPALDLTASISCEWRPGDVW